MRTCWGCGKPYDARDDAQVFCTPKCRQASRPHGSSPRDRCDGCGKIVSRASLSNPAATGGQRLCGKCAGVFSKRGGVQAR